MYGKWVLIGISILGAQATAWASTIAPLLDSMDCSPRWASLTGARSSAQLLSDPKSMSSREPRLAEILQGAAEIVPGNSFFKYGEQNPDQTLGQWIGEILAKRQKFAQRFRELDRDSSRWNQSERRILSQLLDRLIPMQAEQRLRAVQVKVGDRKLSDFLTPPSGAVPSELSAVRKAVSAQLIEYSASMVEGLVAIHLPAVKALGARVRSGASEREIDVVFKNGSAWGEVKYYQESIGLQTKSWDQIYRQARAIAELRPTTVEELHYFAVNGMTEEAAAQLEALGYFVHGPRVRSGD